MLHSTRISVLLLLLFNPGPAHSDESVRFGRDVLPILADRCFECHGPDQAQREADMRLDKRESVMADRGGYAIVVPGNAGASELLKRITSLNDDEVMPPPDSHRKRLTSREVDLLTTWIVEGAPWGRHWAFETPNRPPVPGTEMNPIDAFVQSRLSETGLTLADEAPLTTLIRRVSFDLAGLPPTNEEVDALIADPSPSSYETFVERLLHSPHYGERMTMWWLDAARYSDTDGFQGDETRTNWPWRDWVVQSFNSNMPFDEFTIAQFAGDLLLDATPEQMLATCFHRNHMTNGEGGRDPEESRIDYVLDRVNTTGSVWLGLTLGCCQCHSHKFDPITQKDYYSLFAFFNSINEDGKAGHKAKPYLKYKSPMVKWALDEAQRIVDTRNSIEGAVREAAGREFQPWLAEQCARVTGGFEPWHVLWANSLASVEGSILTQTTDGTIQVSGPNPKHDDYGLVATLALQRVTGLRLEVMPHDTHTDGGLSRGARGEFVLTDVKIQVRRRGESQLTDLVIDSAVADVEKQVTGRDYGRVADTLDDDPRNGWTTQGHDPLMPHVAVFALAEPLVLDEDQELHFVMFHRSTRGDANIGRFRVSVTDQPGDAVRSLDLMPLDELTAAGDLDVSAIDGKLRDRLFNQFLSDHVEYQRARANRERAERQLVEVRQGAGELNVMVLEERSTPRSTHVLERGVWDQPGAQVARAVPEAVLKWPAAKTRTRLDLAKWLVSDENPLTARVIVNQLWQLCFGAALVRTPEDFGLQGELPTHPQLLDWLAAEFVDSNWDVQHVLRLIVTSRTYRQSSRVTPELLERDPENRLLARGARFRLPSWMIRDAALRSSGLLNAAVGGPPVRPYQPEGVWAEMFMGRFYYEPSQGSAQFRRTLYAFWRRAAAPTFLFDSAQRRVCEVRPRRTNTPLHALTLMNDLSMLESSRALARATRNEEDAKSRVNLIFQSVLSRPPTANETNILLRELNRALAHYHGTPEDALQFLEFGQPEQRLAERSAELAGYMVVASMVYNLDEAITHE